VVLHVEFAGRSMLAPEKCVVRGVPSPDAVPSLCPPESAARKRELAGLARQNAAHSIAG
jgi:hypothetical protein